MRRIIIERDGDAFVVREIAPQSVRAIMQLLGYSHEEQVQYEPRPLTVQPRLMPSRPSLARRAVATPRPRVAASVHPCPSSGREVRFGRTG
jgi:arginine decarboxylase